MRIRTATIALAWAATAALGGCLYIDMDEAAPALRAQAAAQEAAAAAAGAAEADTYAGAYFKRQLFVVSDMDRALTLWRDVLGLEPGAITVSGPNSYSREVFAIPPEAAMRFVTMSAGPDQQRTLALLEVTGVPLPRQTGIRTTAAVINARGRLAEIVRRSEAMGLTALPPRPLATATQGTGTEQAILDWDGNVIVLYELPMPDRPNRN